jgi:hypothetical protein
MRERDARLSRRVDKPGSVHAGHVEVSRVIRIPTEKVDPVGKPHHLQPTVGCRRHVGRREEDDRGADPSVRARPINLVPPNSLGSQGEY